MAVRRAALSLGAPTELDAPIRSFPPFSDRLAQVASDGTNFLVVWESFSSSDSVVLGLRLAADGTVLDADPLTLGRGRHPAVAFGGGEYLVAWPAPLPDAGTFIAAQRVSPAGQLLEPQPLSLHEAPYSYATGVGWNGQHFTVAWDDNTFDISAARVTPGGAVLDPTPLALAISSFWSDDTPRVGCQPGECLVTWGRLGTGYQSVAGTLVLADGGFGAPQVLVPEITGVEVRGQDVAAVGTGYLLAFSRGDTMGNSWGLAERVTSALTVLDPGGFATIPVSDQAGHPAVAFNGTSAVLASEGLLAGNAVIWAATVESDAGVSTPASFRSGTSVSAQTAAIASATGAGTLVVWQELDAEGYFHLWASHRSPTLSQDWLTPLGATDNFQDNPALGTLPDGFAVVFRDKRPGAALFYSRLDPNGRPLGPAVRLVGGSALLSGPKLTVAPDAGWAAWADSATGCTVTAAPLAFDGALKVDAGIRTTVSCAARQAMALANDGANAMVAWGSTGVLATRLTADGTPLDQPPRLFADAGTVVSLGLAFDGTNYLVAWANFTGEVQARRVDTSGQVVDPTALDLAPVGGTSGDVSVANVSGHFVVSWSHTAGGVTDSRGGRVSNTGTVLDPGGRVLVSQVTRPVIFTHPEKPGQFVLLVTDTVAAPPTTTLYDLAADLTVGSSLLSLNAREASVGQNSVAAIVVSTEQHGSLLRPVPRVTSRLLTGDADAGLTDAGAPADGGTSDAGSTDAGVANGDAGTDAGASSADAGAVGADGGTASGDAGAEADAGSAVKGPRALAVGCGCDTAPVTWPMLGLFVLGVRRRR